MSKHKLYPWCVGAVSRITCHVYQAGDMASRMACHALRVVRCKHGAPRQPLLYGIPLLLISALALFGAAGSDSALDPDADGDHMTDAYEIYFGLDPVTNDASWDYDNDNLSNLRESVQLIDPFAQDTDRDGFNDDEDDVPISRAYIQWGAPQFTTGDRYDYAHPDWCLNA